MKRFLLLTAFVVPAVGCTSLQTTGPLAKIVGKKDAPAADGKEAIPPADVAAAARPAPPAILITPGEVAPDNPAAALQKLGSEIEYDLKHTPPPPKTPLVSRYKNGERVE